MRKPFLLLLCIQCSAVVFSQNTPAVTGVVNADRTAEPLVGATVTIKGTNQAVLTDNEGRFSIQNENGNFLVLVVSHVGYQAKEVAVRLVAGEYSPIEITLSASHRMGTEVVVTASRRPEKITSAPAAIHVIAPKDLEQFAGSNVGELVAYLPAVEYVRSGVDQITFNARGFNSAFNNKVLQLIDGRISMNVGSGGLPLNNNATTNKEDLEQVEIVLGPQAALYGPNAHNAVFSYRTKDPRTDPGTTVALSGGNQHQFSGRFRQAGIINKKFAYKLTGEYAAGTEFRFYDSVYAGGMIFGPEVGIPERNVDFDFKHLRGEAHVYYRVSPKADLIVSAGSSTNDFLQVTTAGRNQMRDLSFSFLQARFVHRNLFLNVYNSWGTIGNSYGLQPYTRDFWNLTHSTITNPADPRYPAMGRLPADSAELFALRIGNRFRDRNQRLNAEAQYNLSLEKAGLLLVGGLSYQKEKPYSFGTTLVDKDRRISITQFGGALQAEKTLPWQTKLIAAGRLDHHTKFGSLFSPKIGVVKNAGEGSFRLTWGRAYSVPSILIQSASINGVLFGNGEGISYLPNLSNVSDPTSVRVTTPLQPEEISTWEVGYRGNLTKKLFADVNFYSGLSRNFISPTQTIGGRALAVGDVPVLPAFGGTVVNDTLRGASFLTYFNYGDVSVYGLDMHVSYLFSAHVSLSVRYSWFNSDLREDNLKNDANNDRYVSAEEKSLNAAQNRGTAMLSFQNLFKKTMFLTVAARFVEQYDFYSGSQIGTVNGKGKRGAVDRGPDLPPLVKNFDYGPLGGFTSIDMSAGAKLSELLTATMRVSNLLNTRQVEMVGSPSVGRLYSVELKVHVPSKK